ncbi:hypothetical protein V502_01378 [Pseudogymnoascus sp. VKM F-4520 (FW-2644)]|nr:hypothetical protein V502_01378 [Pseudogymnoascus sp. VKM F-4520 (FW-2644)]
MTVFYGMAEKLSADILVDYYASKPNGKGKAQNGSHVWAKTNTHCEELQGRQTLEVRASRLRAAISTVAATCAGLWEQVAGGQCMNAGISGDIGSAAAQIDGSRVAIETFKDRACGAWIGTAIETVSGAVHGTGSLGLGQSWDLGVLYPLDSPIAVSVHNVARFSTTLESVGLCKRRPEVQELNVRIKEATAKMPPNPDKGSAQLKERQQLYTEKHTLLRLARESYREKWFSGSFDEEAQRQLQQEGEDDETLPTMKRLNGNCKKKESMMMKLYRNQLARFL